MKTIYCLCIFLLYCSTAFAEETSKIKKHIAILYFENNTGEQARVFSPLAKGLCNMMISDFSSQNSLKVVERTRLEEILKELELNKSGSIDQKTAAKIGRLAGAEYLVLGAYLEFMGKFRIDARVVEVESGRIIVPSVPAEKQILLKKLKKKSHSGSYHISALLTSHKKNKGISLQTASQYGSALDKLDAGDKTSATSLLKDIVESSPDFVLAAKTLREISQ